MIVNCLILHSDNIEAENKKNFFKPINCFPPLFLSLENYLFNFFSLHYKRASRYNRHNNGESRSFFVVAEIEFHASSSQGREFLYRNAATLTLGESETFIAYNFANHHFVALSLLAHAVSQPVN